MPPSAASLSSGGLAWPEARRVANKVGPRRIDGSGDRAVIDGGLMRFRTKQIHAGVSPDPTTGSILTPIYQTTTYVQKSVDEYMSLGYSYSRSANPTVAALEKKLAELEGGAACACFSTGMAATQATFLAFLNAGDHASCPTSPTEEPTVSRPRSSRASGCLHFRGHFRSRGGEEEPSRQYPLDLH